MVVLKGESASEKGYKTNLFFSAYSYVVLSLNSKPASDSSIAIHIRCGASPCKKEIPFFFFDVFAPSRKEQEVA